MANIGAVDELAGTPLIAVSLKGHLEEVEILLEAGVGGATSRRLTERTSSPLLERTRSYGGEADGSYEPDLNGTAPLS